MKNIKFVLGVLFVLSLFVSQVSYADVSDINLTVKNNGVVVFSNAIALPAAGVVDINDTGGTPHSVDARSVLDIVNITDGMTPSFDISELTYYSSFSAFYLRCMTVSSSNLCDNWQYKVNGTDPGVGMDSSILVGGENVVLFFGDENPPAPEPEPVVIRQSGAPAFFAPSSSGGGGSMTPTISATPVVSVPLTTTPVLEQTVFAEKKESIVVENTVTKNLEVKKIPKKTIKNKAKQKIKVQNTASAINSLENVKVKEVPAPVVQKKSWFRRLFGF